MPNRKLQRKPIGEPKKFPPEAPEARDEGPRLLPLSPEPSRHAIDNSWGRHALELADIALRLGKPKRPAKKDKAG
jgi:hypothetical protein